MDYQFISIYGKFVTSQTVSFSRADTNLRRNFILRTMIDKLLGNVEASKKKLLMLIENDSYMNIQWILQFFRMQFVRIQRLITFVISIIYPCCNTDEKSFKSALVFQIWILISYMFAFCIYYLNSNSSSYHAKMSQIVILTLVFL